MTAIPLSKKLSLLVTSRMVITNATNEIFDLSHQTLIGGFLPRGLNVQAYWGANSKQFVALNFFYASAQLQWQAGRKLFVYFGANYLDSEYPMKWVKKDVLFTDGAHNRRIGFKTSVSYKTIIGPLSIGLAQDLHLADLIGFISIGYFLN